MHEPEPVDLSPLDPERDPARWSALLAATSLRVEATLQRRIGERDPLDVLSRWSRPILAAAGLVLLLGAAGAMLGAPATVSPTDARRLARLSETALLHGRPPSGAQIVSALYHRTAP